MTFGCDGTYEDRGLNEENYYRLVYKRNEAPRIYAREHTGILQREYREKLEKDFKNHPNFDSVNAGKMPYSLRIIKVLYLHDEINGISAFPAPERN